MPQTAGEPRDRSTESLGFDRIVVKKEPLLQVFALQRGRLERTALSVSRWWGLQFGCSAVFLGGLACPVAIIISGPLWPRVVAPDRDPGVNQNNSFLQWQTELPKRQQLP